MLDFRAPSSAELVTVLFPFNGNFIFTASHPDPFLMIVVSSRHRAARDRFNFISSKLPLYDTFVFIRLPVAAAGLNAICVLCATTRKQLRSNKL